MSGNAALLATWIARKQPIGIIVDARMKVFMHVLSNVLQKVCMDASNKCTYVTYVRVKPRGKTLIVKNGISTMIKIGSL